MYSDLYYPQDKIRRGSVDCVIGGPGQVQVQALLASRAASFFNEPCS